MAEYINWNGRLVKKETFFISPDNRGFRYGDGFFETLKIINNTICLQAFHFERLFHSFQLLQFDVPGYYTPDYFVQQVLALVQKNKHSSLARVRLMIYRGDGGLYDASNHFPNFVIQSWPLQNSVNAFNENGLKIDTYREAKKVCDHFSSLKSNNYLPYFMGAFWAKQNHLNDCLILNPNDRIADSTIANVFIVKDGIVKTPALEEGCVNGVMRRYLLQQFTKANLLFEEGTITISDIQNADEVFLTNAINGIRWVKQFGTKSYLCLLSKEFHSKYIPGV